MDVKKWTHPKEEDGGEMENFLVPFLFRQDFTFW